MKMKNYWFLGLLMALAVLFVGYANANDILRVQEVGEGCVSLALANGGTPTAKQYYTCVATLVRFDNLGERERVVWSKKEGDHPEKHRDCNLYLRVDQNEYVSREYWCDNFPVVGNKYRIVVHESGQVVAIGSMEKRLPAE